MNVEPPSLLASAADILSDLSAANQAFNLAYPGERTDRQPVHTVYGGAQLYKAETTRRLGQLAIEALDTYAPTAFGFARALGFPGADQLSDSDPQAMELEAALLRDPEALRKAAPHAFLALTVYERVRRKLEREPVEDFRIDFEDGYGVRSDSEEDADARRAAEEVARGLREGLLPPFIGIRIKPLTEELSPRAVRTLDRFLSALLAATQGELPPGFVVTLPKVTIPEQVLAMERLCTRFEARQGLAEGTIKLELMVETTPSMIDATGAATLPRLLAPARRRVRGVHFGTYDYTASANITAAYQRMDHPACDHARNMMMWAFAGRGLFLSDGATNVLPVPLHRGTQERPLSSQEVADNRAAVHAAFRTAYLHTRHSLETGFYQGWDLHPAQLPVRYAACYAFFLESFTIAAERLKNFVDKAAQATLAGDVFDDAATGQGLLNYFLRALNCGAVSEREVAVTGLSRAELETRSFPQILALRSGRN